MTGHSAWGTIGTDTRLSVPGLTMDAYVSQRGIATVHTMKIDVEGSEKAAIEGARELIERDHPDVLIECNAATCGNNNYSYKELLRSLQGFGYSFYRLYERRLCPWIPSDPQEIIYADYFATLKTPDEIRSRSGWQISNLTSKEVFQNIIDQDSCGDDHKIFVVAVQHELSEEILAESRVINAISRWQALSDPATINTLRTGSA